VTDAPDLAPTTRVAAYALVVDNAQILLVRIAPGYSAVGQWTLPGGGLNFGEDPTVAAIRELEEETGLVGVADGLAFVASWSRDSIPEEGYGPFHAIQIVYRATVTGGSLRDEVDESTDLAAWVPIMDARNLPIVDLVERALAHLEAPELALKD